MKPTTLHEVEIKAKPHKGKPRHMAEKMESYLVRGMGLGGAVLLAILIYSFMQTGNDVPSWMR